MNRPCKKDLKDIPLVVWTTSLWEEDRIFCEETGVSAYVTKPNTFVEMDAAIKSIVKALL